MAERMNDYASDMTDVVRQKPAAITSERALLGSILIEPAYITEVLTMISASDFYLVEHQEIFLAMRELFDASNQIDRVTLIDMLVHKGHGL